jgi:hypothetical protein
MSCGTVMAKPWAASTSGDVATGWGAPASSSWLEHETIKASESSNSM